MRYSKQRELIMEAVFKNRVHPTAEYVYKLLKKDHPELSLGTVYRNLNYLAENNMLKKINVPGGSDRFDGTLTRHQHLICRKCGKIFDVDISELSSVKDKLKESIDFEIDIDTLVMEGVCGVCADK